MLKIRHLDFDCMQFVACDLRFGFVKTTMRYVSTSTQSAC